MGAISGISQTILVVVLVKLVIRAIATGGRGLVSNAVVSASGRRRSNSGLQALFLIDREVAALNSLLVI